MVKSTYLMGLIWNAGDGLIRLPELRDVLKACSEENGLKFSDEQLDQLTLALYEDAAEVEDNNARRSTNGITYGQLRAQMIKHPGLLDNLSIW